MMHPQKVVIPANAGIQALCNALKFPDCRFHGNDEQMLPGTICVSIK